MPAFQVGNQAPRPWFFVPGSRGDLGMQSELCEHVCESCVREKQVK